MQIDEAVEEKVRATFRSVVGRDAEDLQQQLTGIAAAGEETAARALNYALYVCGWVVTDVMDEGVDEPGLEEMAEDLKQGTQEWIDIGTVEQVTEILRAAASFGEVSEETGRELVGAPFVMAGYLLSRYRHPDQRWYEFLDQAWNAAEQQP